MKRLNIFLATIALLVTIVACEDTNENLVGSRGVGVVPLITNLTPESPSISNFETDKFSFKVSLAKSDSLKIKNAELKIDNAEIQVQYGDNVGVLKTIDAFPATIEITASELLTTLGMIESDAKFGTAFNIFVITTSNGVTTRSKANFIVSLPCEFDSNLSIGSYNVVSSDWNVNSSVTLIADENDPYTIYIKGLAEADGLEGNGNMMKVQIDPATYKITGDAVVLAANCGGWGSSYESYTNYTYKVSSGSFVSCEGTYNIVFDISVDQGDFGDNAFVLTRK